NRHAGLQLTSASANIAVLRNAVARNSSGIDLDGSGHLVYANDFTTANATDLIEHAGGNWIVPREQPLAAPANQYFYPPTIDNPHTDSVMNGRNRIDIDVDSSDSATITAVQHTYDAARQQHPDDVIVLRLRGDFVLDGAPLTLGSNTVVLLDGT